MNFRTFILCLAHTKGISAREKWLVLSFMIREKKTEISVERMIDLAKIKYYKELFVSSWQYNYQNVDSFLTCSFISCIDSDYPPQLLHLAHPPIGLFYAGNRSLLSDKMLSIVGTRRVNHYGNQTIRQLVPELIKKNLTIVSGAAKGVDQLAHQAAINAGGRTIAVLGTGIDQRYPLETATLQAQIATQQLLLSEYPRGFGPRKQRFPMRNRIIAALSSGIVVVQAAKKSGSLITAQVGLELGREVFSVPGSIFDPQSEGCHDLIRDGAVCVRHARDILLEIPAF